MAEILLVDDDLLFGEVLQRFLGQRGHRVTWCKSLRQAQNVLADGMCFELILTDMALPDGDGFGLLEQLKTDPWHRSMPVLLLTAHGHWTLSHRARERGMARCLQKGTLSLVEIECALAQELATLAA